MESIFFRRLEPRRSTQTIAPTSVMSVGGFGNITPSAGLMPLDMMNPQYTTQGYTAQTYGSILGSCPRIDSPGLQSVVGTLGNIFSGGSSSSNVGQYNVGAYNWGGYNFGVGNIMGSCPNIDSPGLQSIVGTLGKFFSGGTSSFYSPGLNISEIATCYDFGWTPGCYDFGYCAYIGGGCSYIGGGCLFIGGQSCPVVTCSYISGGCSYIGGGCSYIGGGCGYIGGGCSYIGGGCGYIGGGCPIFGGCMVMDPTPFPSILGTIDSFRQY